MTQPGTQVPRVQCPPCLPNSAPPAPAPFAITADGAARSAAVPDPLFGDTSADTNADTGTPAENADDQVNDEKDGDTAPDTSTDTTR